jgi:hypothetical protein
VDHKVSLAGGYRFYLPKIDVDKDGAASFSYYEDQGKAFVKYLMDGKVDKTSVTKEIYVLHHTQLRKNEKNVWAITKVMSRSGSDKCQP